MNPIYTPTGGGIALIRSSNGLRNCTHISSNYKGGNDDTQSRCLDERNAQFVEKWPIGLRVHPVGQRGIIVKYYPDHNGYLRAIVRGQGTLNAVPECQLEIDTEYYLQFEPGNVIAEINTALACADDDNSPVAKYLRKWKARIQ